MACWCDKQVTWSSFECDRFVESYANGLAVRIIKHLRAKSGLNSFEFPRVQYVRLKACTDVTTFQFTILDAETLRTCPFLAGTTRCTLHFKQQI